MKHQGDRREREKFQIKEGSGKASWDNWATTCTMKDGWNYIAGLNGMVMHFRQRVQLEKNH